MLWALEGQHFQIHSSSPQGSRCINLLLSSQLFCSLDVLHIESLLQKSNLLRMGWGELSFFSFSLKPFTGKFIYLIHSIYWTSQNKLACTSGNPFKDVTRDSTHNSLHVKISYIIISFQSLSYILVLQIWYYWFCIVFEISSVIGWCTCIGHLSQSLFHTSLC